MTYWKARLTRMDMDLARMVEDLTGKPCTMKNGGDHYFFEADYETHQGDPECLSALWEAIEGRVGDRLLKMEDNPERHAFWVSVLFKETHGDILKASKPKKADVSMCNTYIPRGTRVRAARVTRYNAEALVEFVGGGEMEIPEEGPCVFHFANAGGMVYEHAPEHSYIIYLGKERYTVMDKKEFEKEYEQIWPI